MRRFRDQAQALGEAIAARDPYAIHRALDLADLGLSVCEQLEEATEDASPGAAEPGDALSLSEASGG